MPPTQPRAWGTRFDSLPSSPPSTEALSNHGSIPPSSPPPALQPKEERLSHDASVFVGSLPDNVDHVELRHRLAEHLSQYTTIKSVKVIRDSKGGVCAFVQCQDASSASVLIEQLHSDDQKPFLGRILRYEQARAFRTLLISYRKPMKYDSGAGTYPPFNACQSSVELEPPGAMLLWKPKNSRFHTILYNKEAIEADDHRSQSALVEDSVYLCPVNFDSESIHRLAAYFGPLELIKAFEISQLDSSETVSRSTAVPNYKHYPPPHDGPRLPGMDTSCWEVKWEHRDDCVNAMMTLRRVPHLTVTWAHQPADHRLPLRTRSPHSMGNSFRPSSPQNRPRFPFPLRGMPSRHVRNGMRNNSVNIQYAEEKQCHSPSIDAGFTSWPVKEPKWTELDFPPLHNSKGGLRELHDDTTTLDSRAEPTSLSTLGYGESIGERKEPTPKNTPEEHSSMQSTTSTLEVAPLSASIVETNSPSGRSYDDRQFGRNNYDEYTERQLDPTTLFVGGLEMFGPGAWDEEKIRVFFNRFEGLESVKFVKPQGSHAAFAFIKFNNTESPSRAVMEEHNRVYNGRTMRVQLRDCNPPRNPWRQGRGRGRFQYPRFTHSHQSNHAGEQVESVATNEHEEQDQRSSDTMLSIEPSAISTSLSDYQSAGETNEKDDKRSLPRDSPSTTSTQSPVTKSSSTKSSSSSASIREAALPIESSVSNDKAEGHSLKVADSAENYREWYDMPTTPPLNCSAPLPGSSPASGAASYSTVPLASGIYYPPVPWVHPYPHSPYQISYYTGYSAPTHPPTQCMASTSSDHNGPLGSHAAWSPTGMYGSYLPYGNYSHRAPNIDQAQVHGVNGPPVAPAGFIQNDQGTLIAIYQPEALDRYLAESGSGSSSISHHYPAHTPGWLQYPQVHPYPLAQSQAPKQPFSRVPINTGWMRFHPPQLYDMPSQTGHFPPPTNHRYSGVQDKYHDGGGGYKPPFSQRGRASRRPGESSFVNNRNAYFRGRQQPRGNMPLPEFPERNENGPSPLHVNP